MLPGVLKIVTAFGILGLHSNELFEITRNKSALTSPGKSSLSKLDLTANFPKVIFFIIVGFSLNCAVGITGFRVKYFL